MSEFLSYSLANAIYTYVQIVSDPRLLQFTVMQYKAFSQLVGEPKQQQPH